MSEVFSIYPQRAISGLEEVTERLDQPPEPLLSEKQQERVLAFESALYVNELPASEFPNTLAYLEELKRSGQVLPGLEEVWRKKINSVSFGLGYFLTEEGQKAYEQVFQEALNATSTDAVEEELRKRNLLDFKSAALNELGGDSVEFEEDRVVDEFAKRDFQDVEGVEEPHIISIIKNPLALVDKAQKYRLVKNYLRAVTADIKTSTEDQQVKDAKLFIVNKYRQRVNKFLAALYPQAFSLLRHHRVTKDKRTAKQLGELRACMPAFNYLEDDHRIAQFLERIDHFRYGMVHDEAGNPTIIDPQLYEFLQATEQKERVKEIDREGFSEISTDKISGLGVEVEIMRKWLAAMLDEWDLLSEYEDYDTDREECAPDGKWQAVASKKFKSLSVDGKQGAVKFPLTDTLRPAIQAVPVDAHESAHVWQEEYKKRFGRLLIMQEIGIEDASVFHEAGAKWWEREVRERLTGYKDIDIAGTSYLAAIEARLEGKDFARCMQAFFEDFCRRNSDLPVKEAAKRAVNRTRRIYRSGGDFAKGTNHLTNSQTLHYLEQELVVAKLPPEHRRLLLLGGVTLNSLITLRDIGLINLSDIQLPNPLPWKILPDLVREALKD
jgi:hypothetical protein